MNNDTIAAISTAIGESGIGVIRLSGRKAIEISGKIFHSPMGKKLSSCASHTVHYGRIESPKNGEVIDEVLLTIMRSPRTYTKEDIVEISCHGGKVSLKKVLELCLEHGARLAEPGEFTKRAFLNGRIDLAQAEAVLDIIKSETDISQKAALKHLEGAFSGEVRALREFIINIISSIELSIDFSQEDMEFPQIESVIQRVKEAECMIKKILRFSQEGMILREGASVVICGRPNVGKSSLMNALLGHERVIVTPVAGTTRDFVEESINISGIKIKLSDTAGIIKPKNIVDREGVKRSKKKIEGSDVVIFMLDYNRPFSRADKEIYENVKGKNAVIVINKTDLAPRLEIDHVRRFFGSEKILKVSVLKKKGLESLKKAVIGKIFKNNPAKWLNGEILVTNLRHKKVLEEARRALERAERLTGPKYNAELLANDLNEAVYYLGLIIGESIDDKVLDRIFSQFCIGK